MAIAIARNYWALRFDMPWTMCAANRFPTSSEQGYSGGPGISLRYCGRQDFLLLDLLCTRFWFVQWQPPFLYRFPVQRLFRGILNRQDAHEVQRLSASSIHSYLPSD